MSPRSTTLPLYFCNFWFKVRFFEGRCPSMWQSELSFLSLCASRITSFLLLTFSCCHAGIVSSFFHYLSTASFASGIFHRLCHGNKIVNQIVMGHRGNFFCLQCGLRVFSGERRFHSLPGGSGFHLATLKLSLEPCEMHSGPQPASCCQSESFFLNGMASSVGHSNFLLACVRVFLSSIVEFWFLVFFHSFSILSGFPNFGPYFRPYMIWSRSRLNFCHSPHIPPDSHISSGRFLFQ